VTQAKQGVARILRGKEDEEALACIIITPRNIPIRRHTVVQAHLLPENIGDMEWMN
jgi:hypothetical protein